MPGAALFAALVASASCTLPRRQVMLVLSTDMECAVFDRFEVKIFRGPTDSAVWSRVFLRNDCPAVGASIPRAPLARSNGSDPGVPYRLGIVDERRTDARVRIEVVARRPDAQVMEAKAETDFVDGQVYAVPMELAQACLTPLPCPATFACRRDSAGNAACGSVYRTPGTLGTFTATTSLTADETIDLDDLP